ncbi:MAG: ribonuclease HI family protein [Candidatus Pacebacteria bacterium]|nr:ribonuclease HI family protein [Candidatus Paceibacterota bacterium]
MEIYTDGGSRGNPGPSAAGFTVDGVGYGKFLGVNTNNFAEYTAVILALKKVIEISDSKSKQIDIDLKSDSLLLINQLNGKFKVKALNLKPLFNNVCELRKEFKLVKFTHVYREKNKEADEQVNIVLDKQMGR